MPWILAALPAAIGLYQAIAGNKRAKDAQSKIQPYQTPSENREALQFSQYLSQGGFSPQAMDYLTSNIERAESSSLNAINRAGGTANDINNVLDTTLQAYMNLGAQDSVRQFQNFDRYLNTLGVIAQNKDAEWADQRNLLKDEMQQAAQMKAQGIQNIGNGINAGIQAYSNNQQMNLYNQDQALKNQQWQQMFGGSQLPSVQQTVGNYGSIGPMPDTVAVPNNTPYYLTPRNYSSNEVDAFANRWASYLPQ